MSRISNRLEKVLVDLQESIQAIALTKARHEAQDSTLPKFMTRSAEWYDGLMQGKISTLETLLMSHNSYKGFTEYTEKCELTGVTYTFPHYYRAGQ
jgi:hypothetical protein